MICATPSKTSAGARGNPEGTVLPTKISTLVGGTSELVLNYAEIDKPVFKSSDTNEHTAILCTCDLKNCISSVACRSGIRATSKRGETIETGGPVALAGDRPRRVVCLSAPASPLGQWEWF